MALALRTRINPSLSFSWTDTECVRDLDKLNLVKLCYGGMVLGLSQFLILTQLSTASKNDISLKSGQKWLKNNHLDFLVYIRDTLFTKLDHTFYHLRTTNGKVSRQNNCFTSRVFYFFKANKNTFRSFVFCGRRTKSVD